MNVEYWEVSAVTAVALPMRRADISTHLLNDWLPYMPNGMSKILVGWPPYILDHVDYNHHSHLSISENAGKSERQWKGMLSWMLGVAGARHTLRKEGYRWVAPLSAFYHENKLAVDLKRWHRAFPRTRLIASASTAGRLRPDYIALKYDPATSMFQWAIAESKGTNSCLTNMGTCPRPWHNQARNIQLTINGLPYTVPRHLVVATRVNPNAVHGNTRRLQVRAWNSKEKEYISNLAGSDAVLIAAGQLYHLFNNLQLHATANAIAESVEYREQANISATSDLFGKSRLKERSQLAVKELALPIASETLPELPFTTRIETDFGVVQVEITSELRKFVLSLCNTTDSIEAGELFVNFSSLLEDQFYEPTDSASSMVTLPIGIRLRFPQQFN